MLIIRANASIGAFACSNHLQHIMLKISSTKGIMNAQ